KLVEPCTEGLVPFEKRTLLLKLGVRRDSSFDEVFELPVTLARGSVATEFDALQIGQEPDPAGRPGLGGPDRPAVSLAPGSHLFRVSRDGGIRAYSLQITDPPRTLIPAGSALRAE